MSNCEPITGCVIQSSTFCNKARLTDFDDVALLQADIASITWKAWDADNAVLVNDTALSVSTVISDTLLTTGWDVDAIGYNFSHIVEDDVCTTTGVHTIRYHVTLSGGQSFYTRKFQPDVQASEAA